VTWIINLCWLLCGVAIGTFAQAFADAARYICGRHRLGEVDRRIAEVNAKADRLAQRLKERS
jgi:hypothetical protein